MKYTEGNSVINCYITRLRDGKKRFGINETDKIGGWFRSFCFPNFSDGVDIKIINGVICYKDLLPGDEWYGLMIAINENKESTYQIHACSYGKTAEIAAKNTIDLWHYAWEKIDSM